MQSKEWRKTLIVVGPRVLISPDKDTERTGSGLYLPPTVKEKEEVQSGLIVKIGPGYPVPDTAGGPEEPWAVRDKNTRYVALQAEPGDYALFLRKEAVEVEFQQEKYLIVPHSAILALVRTELNEE